MDSIQIVYNCVYTIYGVVCWVISKIIYIFFFTILYMRALLTTLRFHILIFFNYSMHGSAFNYYILMFNTSEN
jgi:hypothetical protein